MYSVVYVANKLCLYIRDNYISSQLGLQENHGKNPQNHGRLLEKLGKSRYITAFSSHSHSSAVARKHRAINVNVGISLNGLVEIPTNCISKLLAIVVSMFAYILQELQWLRGVASHFQFNLVGRSHMRRALLHCALRW